MKDVGEVEIKVGGNVTGEFQNDDSAKKKDNGEESEEDASKKCDKDGE